MAFAACGLPICSGALAVDEVLGGLLDLLTLTSSLLPAIASQAKEPCTE